MIGPTEDQIERAAQALREHDMKGRITRPWDIADFFEEATSPGPLSI
jgi:hypothetical protein